MLDWVAVRIENKGKAAREGTLEAESPDLSMNAI
jgi:hypothetical protein